MMLDAAQPEGADVPDIGDRRGLARPRRRPNEAALERVVQRVGHLSEFTEAQIRQIAAIALAAVSVDDADRQRRDELARDNRRRLRALGRD
jgi:hypothetical protein